MEAEGQQKKNPRGLHCLSIGSVWEMAKELAGKEGRTVSSYIRAVIKKLYEEDKQNQPLI